MIEWTCSPSAIGKAESSEVAAVRSTGMIEGQFDGMVEAGRCDSCSIIWVQVTFDDELLIYVRTECVRSRNSASKIFVLTRSIQSGKTIVIHLQLAITTKSRAAQV